jgi:Holliday junction DNA helicase RuvA
MFNSLKGTITEKTDASLCLDTGGVEWLLAMPRRDVEALPPPGNVARVFTWLQHTEDAMNLYGFSTAARRTVFLELLKVQGVGPKAAIKILSGLGEAELEAALDTEDLDKLESIPGLGRKTAQKMILALKGKLNTGPAPEEAGAYADLVGSIAAMGYERRTVLEVLKAADEALHRGEGLSKADYEKELFREAVLRLSGIA